MKRIRKQFELKYAIFFLLVLLSRIPFLGQGFGLEANAWGVALAARNIHDSGVYEASRFPGFPVHELLCALVVSHGAFAANLLVALFSSAGVLLFVLTLRHLRFRFPLLGGAMLAAVPVMYTASVINYDFALALAFVLASLYAVSRQLPVTAGILLGLAIGCRITSGAMVLPFAILLSRNAGMPDNIRRISRFLVAAVVTGILVFLPVISQYGFGFFTYERTPYPDISSVLFRFFVDVWGPVGLAALGMGIILLIVPQRPGARYLFPRSVNERHVVAWLIAIDLYIIAFLKLPSSPGFLLPIVPFVILLFGKYLPDRVFRVFAFLVLLSPLVVSLSRTDAPDAAFPSVLQTPVTIAGSPYAVDWVRGPVFCYTSQRAHSMENMKHLFRRMNDLGDLSLVIAGRWYRQVQYMKEDLLKNDRIIFVEYMDQTSLAYYFQNGYDLYYLPGEDRNNALRYGFAPGDLYDAAELGFQ